jgi:hypothetical protein
MQHPAFAGYYFYCLLDYLNISYCQPEVPIVQWQQNIWSSISKAFHHYLFLQALEDWSSSSDFGLLETGATHLEDDNLIALLSSQSSISEDPV